MAEITHNSSGKLAQEEHINDVSQPLTPSPSHSEGETSPIPNGNDEPMSPTSQKRKKKKKPKKSVKAKEAAALAAKTKADDLDLNKPPVLCISRNKHWRYISSYHVCSYSLFGTSLRGASCVIPGSMAPTTSGASRIFASLEFGASNTDCFGASSSPPTSDAI